MEAAGIPAVFLNEKYTFEQADVGGVSFLCKGKTVIDGVPILDAMHLIPFKDKAWLDLRQRKETGAKVDSKNIRKHKNDVIRLSMLLRENDTLDLPQAIRNDMKDFLAAMREEPIDLKALGIRGTSQEEITGRLLTAYILDK